MNTVTATGTTAPRRHQLTRTGGAGTEEPIILRFTDRNGRSGNLAFGGRPLPHLHEDLARAFTESTDRSADITLDWARGLFSVMMQFLDYLNAQDDTPAAWSELTVGQVDGFVAHKAGTALRSSAVAYASRLRSVLQTTALRSVLNPQVQADLAAPSRIQDIASSVVWPADLRRDARERARADDPRVALIANAEGFTRAFDFAPLPVPGMHEDLCRAFARRHAAAGEPLSSHHVRACFLALRGFLGFLGELPDPPRELAAVTAQHMIDYRSSASLGATPAHSTGQLNRVREVLRHATPYSSLAPCLREYLEYAPMSDTAGSGVPAAREAAAEPAVPTRTAAVRPARGRPSAMPAQGLYDEAPSPVKVAATLVVPFTGEDGRSVDFDFSDLPLPELRAELASAFAVRVGATGSLRTRSSATGVLGIMRRFLHFLDSLPSPPRKAAELTPKHLERFRLHRSTGLRGRDLGSELTALMRVLRAVSPAEALSTELREYISRPGHARGRQEVGLPGYSDREFQAVVTAARSEVVAIRDRIREGERLLAAYRDAPDELTDDERERAGTLDQMDRTGRVPLVRHDSNDSRQHAQTRTQTARALFLTETDLLPLLLLGAALTGRNLEVLKELSPEHRVLEERAVALTLVKRRRGKAASREGVHWETGGNESRQLHTPGGFYLLLHQLTARGRRFSGDRHLWSVWNAPNDFNGTGVPGSPVFGHTDPFAQKLGRALSLVHWAAAHNLTDDNGEPLKLSFNAIKTTVEVRTTKAMGGHLPSASRTNTLDVSFAHYLQGDPRIREWADEILTTAISEAESSARAYRPRVLDREETLALAADPQAAAEQFGTTAETITQAISGQLNTVAGACLDNAHGPFGEGQCGVSFLTCLRCPNVLITADHLPMLLALVDSLTRARQEMDLDSWLLEHGRTWVILTRLVLPKFTDAEQDKARGTAPTTLHLSLLDLPKESP